MGFGFEESKICLEAIQCSFADAAVDSNAFSCGPRFSHGAPASLCFYHRFNLSTFDFFCCFTNFAPHHIVRSYALRDVCRLQ